MKERIPIKLDIGQAISVRETNWYKVVQYLGSGANSITYLVVCSQGMLKGGFFALKIFYKISEVSRRQKFLEEISFLKEINHPSIMQVYDEGIFHSGSGDYPFVVVDYLPSTFRQLDYSSLNITDKLCFTLQLLSGITLLQSRQPPVVHRDIKPENIFLKGRTCVIGDFGLMKRLDTVDEIDREIYKHSPGPGMPFYYRTPDLVEYANNRAPLSDKTDVFQLGLVIAELFTGVNPCMPSDDILAPIELAKIKFINCTLGYRIFSLISRMLTSDPTQRPYAKDLMDPWQAAFMEAVNASHVLHGHVFAPIKKV